MLLRKTLFKVGTQLVCAVTKQDCTDALPVTAHQQCGKRVTLYCKVNRVGHGIASGNLCLAYLTAAGGRGAILFEVYRRSSWLPCWKSPNHPATMIVVKVRVSPVSGTFIMKSWLPGRSSNRS